ncbi:hypothetical protein KSF78_0004293 [Schistosoma japonicum]|nr:hypothetical protein KSF78_0004293 [Schistosoma japonicum]
MNKAIFVWTVCSIFLFLLVLKLNEIFYWNWFIIFIPMWLVDVILFTASLLYMSRKYVVTILFVDHSLSIKFTHILGEHDAGEMRHNCGIQEVNNIDMQRRKYHLNHFHGRHSESEVNFTLNVFGISFLQLSITFAGVNLFIQIGVYLLLQLIWEFIPALSRKYPYNIFYLIIMTFLSTFAIASDTILYGGNVVYVIFALSITLFNLVICTVTVTEYDFTKLNLISVIFSIVTDILALIAQILYSALSTHIPFIIIGAVMLPLVVFKLFIEIKKIYGNGKYYYNRIDMVYAAGVIYNCWWRLLLAFLWASSIIQPTDVKNITDSTVLFSMERQLY